MQARKGTYYVVVVEDVACSKLVCCGTLLVELKFIHETSKVHAYTHTHYNIIYYNYIIIILYIIIYSRTYVLNCSL